MKTNTFDPTVSKFDCAKNPAPEGDRLASAVSTHIAGKTLAATIAKLRALYAKTYSEACLTMTEDDARKTAKDAVADLKCALPGITWSGTFSYRANKHLTTHSGCICADLDHIYDPAVLAEVRAKLMASPYLCTVFLSPTGTGLKAVFRVPSDAARHLATWFAVAAHVKELTGLDIDVARKDVVGLCFLSHDAECRWNGEALEMPVPADEGKTGSNGDLRAGATNGTTPAALKRRAETAKVMLSHLEMPDDVTGLCECPGINQHTTGNGARDCRVKLDGTATIHCFHGSCLPAVTAMNHRLRTAIEAQEHQWREPDPLPPEHPPVEPFNYDLLPFAFQGYVRDVAERMQCPPDYVAVGIMVAAGSVVGRKVGIHPKRHDDWRELCNFWGAIVGPPSVKKSPALAQALYPLDKLVAEALTRHETATTDFAVNARVGKARKKHDDDEITKAFKTGGEDAAREVAKKQEAGCRDEPRCQRYMVNDATMEKLGELLNENPNWLLCFRDELAGWLRSMDKDGHENDRAFALECWSGKAAYTYDRIERGTIRVETAMFGVLGGIQPGVLAEYVSASVRGGSGNDGLIQRFSLTVWPEIDLRYRHVDRPPDKAAKDAVMEVFRKLDELNAENIGAISNFDGIPCLRFTADAQEIFDRWHEKFENELRSSEEHPAVVSHFAKYRKLVPVMALLCHLCDGGTGPVPAEPLKRALGWRLYLASHARKIYGSVSDGGAAAARQIAKRVDRGDLDDGFTLRQVYNNGWTGLPDARTAAGRQPAALIPPDAVTHGNRHRRSRAGASTRSHGTNVTASRTRAGAGRFSQTVTPPSAGLSPARRGVARTIRQPLRTSRRDARSIPFLLSPPPAPQTPSRRTVPACRAAG